MGVRPYNILAVTFTNKARGNGNPPGTTAGQQVKVGFGWAPSMQCARIYAGSRLFTGKSNFVIMDADDQEALVRRV